MPTNQGEMAFFTDAEVERIERIAQARGLSLQDAASQLLSQEIQQRYRAGMGHAPARVYSMPKQSKEGG